MVVPCSQPRIGASLAVNVQTGYNGTTCENDINECESSPCQNGGTCSQSRIGEFSCQCALGFTGQTCSTDINECSPDPCQNGGTCSQPLPGQFSCECQDGYNGTTCENDINECESSPCQNGGTCSQPTLNRRVQLSMSRLDTME